MTCKCPFQLNMEVSHLFYTSIGYWGWTRNIHNSWSENIAYFFLSKISISFVPFCIISTLNYRADFCPMFSRCYLIIQIPSDLSSIITTSWWRIVATSPRLIKRWSSWQQALWTTACTVSSLTVHCIEFTAKIQR